MQAPSATQDGYGATVRVLATEFDALQQAGVSDVAECCKISVFVFSLTLCQAGRAVI
jgi:hypothetical protein